VYLFRVCAAWLLLFVLMAAPAFAQGVVVVRRTPLRPFVGPVAVRQRVVVAPFRQAFVQPLYAQQFNAGYAVQQFAAPVYQQQFVQPFVQQYVAPQQFVQPYVQQFNGGCNGVQQFNAGGCQQLFR